MTIRNEPEQTISANDGLGVEYEFQILNLQRSHVWMRDLRLLFQIIVLSHIDFVPIQSPQDSYYYSQFDNLLDFILPALTHYVSPSL